jgi:hypothetical protein
MFTACASNVDIDGANVDGTITSLLWHSLQWKKNIEEK